MFHRVRTPELSHSTISSDRHDAFSQNYCSARLRFRNAAKAAGACLEQHPISALGPNGEDLTIDVARIGDERASSALVVTSGLHGVEGFLGSAVQLELLRQEFDRFPGEKLQLVMIHGLNPWGFSHLRRVNEDNVDPNRNLIAANDSYARVPDGYDKADPILNPKCPPSLCADAMFMLLGASQIFRLGMRRCKQMVATGQYEYPQGLFYGGRQPVESHRVIKQNLERWLGDAHRVVHLDFHTGLGRWASHCLLLDTPIDQGRLRWLDRVFPNTAIEPCNAKLPGYGVRGSYGQWSQEMLPDCEYTYLCAEFGTYSPLFVLRGLRAENQAHHWCAAESPVRLKAKQRLAELFCPASAEWRRQAMLASIDLVNAGVSALDS